MQTREEDAQLSVKGDAKSEENRAGMADAERPCMQAAATSPASSGSESATSLPPPAAAPGPGSGFVARIRLLVGEGDHIMGAVFPFALVGIAANALWPSVFHVGLGGTRLVLGGVLLLLGIPLWFTSVAQILACVPKRKLITRGPFAIVLHPLYTSVALLVVPGLGLLFGSWLGCVLGFVLYVVSRRFAPREERELARRFPDEYRAYRERVLIPWL